MKTIKILRITSTIVAILSFMVILYAVPASAATQDDCNTDKNATLLGLPKWYKYLEYSPGPPDNRGKCSPVLSFDASNTEETEQEQKVNSALPIGLAVFEGMLRLSGIVAVVMIFWSGFKYITSQGNPEAAAGARKTAINALIGLAIVILATTLVSFVGNSLLP